MASELPIRDRSSLCPSGFRAGERLYESDETVVFRAARIENGERVIVKLRTPKGSTPVGLGRCRYEYEVLRRLSGPEIIKALGLEGGKDTMALVMEDCGGQSLSRLMDTWERAGSAAFPLRTFIAITEKLVRALSIVHAAGVIHKDVCPANVVYNPADGELRLIDFDISATLDRENLRMRIPGSLEGTLAYMSPEQTGRMNRTLDYRSDYYSLGAALYELLTGAPPFEGADAIEMVHRHLAGIPVPPHIQNPSVPEPFSALVMKLLAKAPEDRYQSARGILKDLEALSQVLAGGGKHAVFEPGRYDRPERFSIPEKLYGRESQMEALISAFEWAARGEVRLIMVTGQSGIGKSSIVNEIDGPIVRRRGVFIKGKYNQLGRGTPFSAIAQAVGELAEILRAESPGRLADRKTRILTALGDGAGILVEVVPELEAILGPQPKAPELFGEAAANRFNLLFHRFIDAVATAEHPLAIFLDNLQWADTASLDLIRFLVGSRRAGYVLFICAYRENEADAGHPVRLLLDDCAGAGALLDSVALKPLDAEEVTELTADTLGCSLSLARPLADLVHAKTEGNPFFVHQFLRNLFEEGLIVFDEERGSWQCDIMRISRQALSGDVVKLLSQRLDKLAKPAREALKLAACIGNSFDLAALSVAAGRSKAETANDLWNALQAGLILPQNEMYKYFRDATDWSGDALPGGSPSYMFLHDRVQQAAYALIPARQTKAIHLRIARILKRETPKSGLEAKVFELADQYDRGMDLVSDTAERLEIARLNLAAGRKAKSATAFKNAVDYFSFARQALPDHAWRDHYGAALEIYEASAEAAFLIGDFAGLDGFAGIVLANAGNVLETVVVHELKGYALMAKGELQQAIRYILGILPSFGLELTMEPDDAAVATIKKEVAESCGGRPASDFLELPQMTDPRQLAVMRLLECVVMPAYLSASRLHLMVRLMQVLLSLRHGNMSISGLAYSSYGMMLCSEGRIEEGYSFGRLAMDLYERTPKGQWFGKDPIVLATTMATFIAHWKNHVRESIAAQKKAYARGLEIGDFPLAALSAFCSCMFPFALGVERDLPGIKADAAVLMESVRQLRLPAVVDYFKLLLQALDDALGGRGERKLMRGDIYDETVMIPRHEKINDGNALFFLHFCKLILNVLYGDFEAAIADSDRAEKYLGYLVGMPYGPVYHLYDSLARMGGHTHADAVSPEMIERIDANMARLTAWAEHAPMNFRHKCSLVAAERHRLLGESAKAVEAYADAIREAGRDGYIREEALANERAASFYREWGNEAEAVSHLQAAARCYAMWGAGAKTAELERAHPAIRRADAAPRRTAGSPSTHRTPASHLDLQTIVKASLALSREIDLKKLVAQLMHIAIENAGAERGALILEKDGRWIIEAVGHAANRDVDVAHAHDLEGSRLVSAGIVSHVIRTAATVLLEDAVGTGEFVGDPYVARGGIKSVLCMPLLNQSRISGILYLENNLVRGAFSAERQELLDMLSSQMALCLDNARLFASNREEIAERTAAEEALRKSEERFRTIFDSVNDSIFVHDPATGAILDVNAAMCAMYGYTREEALRLRVEDLSSGEPPYTQREAMAWIELAAEGKPQVFEWKGRHRDGHTFWMEIGMKKASIGGQDRILVVGRDIGERKRLNEELERRVRERTADLTEANKELESFAYSVSHDLRAPLRAINGYAGILTERHASAMDDDGRSLFAKLRENTERMGVLINDMLSFSRASRAAVNAVPMDMTAIARSAAEECAPPARCMVNVAALPGANGDPALIRQVWVNLISNAVKFSSTREKPVVDIGSSAGADGETAYFVRDNGVGFDMKYSEKLFGVFQRLHLESDFEGTGVGLAIAYRIIKRHGGRIWAIAEPDKGATFLFTLP